MLDLRRHILSILLREEDQLRDPPNATKPNVTEPGSDSGLWALKSVSFKITQNSRISQVLSSLVAQVLLLFQLGPYPLSCLCIAQAFRRHPFGLYQASVLVISWCGPEFPQT